VPRLYVGIVYGDKNLFTTGHRGHAEKPKPTTDDTDFGKQVFCAGLQSTRVIGHIFWAGFTAHSW
jgi:hypothetical protein